MRYTFWYGTCDEEVIECMEQAITDIQENTWSGTLYIDGYAWSDQQRKEGAMRMFEALGDNQSVTSLVFCNAQLDADILKKFEQMLEDNIHIESIVLKRLKYNNNPLILPSQLFNANTKRKQIRVEGCRMDLNAWTTLAGAIDEGGPLCELTFHAMEMDECIPDSFVESLVRAKGLRHLRLDNVVVAKQDFDKLVTAIGKNTSLTEVCFEQMGINSVMNIAEMCLSNANLKALSLRKNNLDANCIRDLTDCLRMRNSSLKVLKLSCNPIGDEGAEHIIRYLQEDSLLRELCLMRTEITRDGCVQLARGLSCCQGLKHIALDGNKMEECADELLQALQSNVFLSQVFGRLAILVRTGKPVWRKINHLLRLNKAKRRAVTEPLMTELLPNVLEASSQEPELMFYMIRNLPCIFAPPLSSKLGASKPVGIQPGTLSGPFSNNARAA